jgi:hypothetical protein
MLAAKFMEFQIDFILIAGLPLLEATGNKRKL